VRGCPKHCSFCSVWRTDGQRPRQRSSDAVIEEIVQLRRLGFRFIALADDNFYPVTLTDLELARRQGDAARIAELTSLREERFSLMRRLAQLPADMVFFTQITMEAAEDPKFLDAMFEATADVAQRAGLTFAQFVMLTPFPGTVDFARWEKMMEPSLTQIGGVPITRRWLIPQHLRPKLFWPHPEMSGEEIRTRTQAVWDRFYSLGYIWKRSSFIKKLRNRLTFVLISKIYRQMYADSGIATDSARVARSVRWARWLARPCQYLFSARPMPHLKVPPSPPAPRTLRAANAVELTN
jgi:radical SAM superfamily enzyme YgiQ (UPF0313 family)